MCSGLDVWERSALAGMKGRGTPHEGRGKASDPRLEVGERTLGRSALSDNCHHIITGGFQGRDDGSQLLVKNFRIGQDGGCSPAWGPSAGAERSCPEAR